MKYGSVCSGIEAATVAWHPLGWQPQWFSEIAKFPCAVLAHHYPDVPNLGDMTRIHERREFRERKIDLLVGGTPCPSFSVAGLRQGLADPRGNLALEFLRLAQESGARWLVWENVPGVLSSNGGRDFGSILGAMGKLGYGWAYRVLDAQFWGVPQRRRRVFVVGYLGDWRRAAAVLFEPDSLLRNPSTGRKKGPVVAALTASGVGTCGADDNQGQAGHLVPAISPALTANYGKGPDSDATNCMLVVPILEAGARTGVSTNDPRAGLGIGAPNGPMFTLQAGKQHAVAVIPFDTTQITSAANRARPEPGDPCHPIPAHGHAPTIAFSSKDHGADAGEVAPTMRAMGHTTSHANSGGQIAIAYQCHGSNVGEMGVLRRGNGNVTGGVPFILQYGVRRLTERECARLQGFPDGYLSIPYNGKIAKGGPLYHALGNSMAVPVMRWIGERIQKVEEDHGNH